jgi:hypothetical protein
MTDLLHDYCDVPLADVLSVTTGKLLSRRKMTGLRELVVWLTGPLDGPWPTLRAAVDEFLGNAAAAKEELLRQHAFLVDLLPPSGVDGADLYSWLLAAEEVHGEQIVIERSNGKSLSQYPNLLAGMAQFELAFRKTGAALAATFARVAESMSELGRQLGESSALEAGESDE